MDIEVKLPNYSEEQALAILSDEIWDDGKMHPSLTHIWIHKDLRGQGLGEKLFLEVLSFMKTHKIRRLYFTNGNVSFWDVMKKKYPRRIHLMNSDWGVIGL